MIKRLCIIGVGLIGGSLALSLKKAKYCEKIIGCGLEQSQLERAISLDVIDEFSLNVKEAVKDADMVLLSVPIRAIESILNDIKSELGPGCIVTDTGSAKGSVIELVRKASNNSKLLSNFVPGHPIAGGEKSTVEAAVDNLFYNKKVVLTPIKETGYRAIDTTRKMWQIIGANVEIMDFQEHDNVFAATSHLPHLLAYSLINTLSNSSYDDSIFEYTASGFKSFSRIASSDPIMWRDICLDNKVAILSSLENYEESFLALKNAIQSEDMDKIQQTFENAKMIRDNNVHD